jgi:hypothetical protein
MHCKCESHHSPSDLSASYRGGGGQGAESGGQGAESGSRCSSIFWQESDISIEYRYWGSVSIFLDIDISPFMSFRSEASDIYRYLSILIDIAEISSIGFPNTMWDTL